MTGPEPDRAAPGSATAASETPDDRGSPLTLAVASRAESYDRLRERLAVHDIAVEHARYSERTFHLGAESTDGDAAGPAHGTDPEDSPGPADVTGPEDAAGESGERDVATGADEPDAAAVDPAWTDLPTDADVGLVFPGRIMEGGVVDALLDVPWVNDREAILRSRNKGGALARIADAGLPVPETVVVSNPVDEAAVADAVDRVGAPAVIKPNSTTRGVGVARVGDADSALGVADYLELVHGFDATGDRSYLVQEYVPDARDYRVMVIDGRYAGAVERRLPEAERAAGRWKHNVHRGAVAEGVDLPPERRRLAERTAAVLGIDYLGVDLLVTDDRALVNETNARPTVDDPEKYVPDFDARLAALIRETAANG